MDILTATKMNNWKKKVVKVTAIAMRPLLKRAVIAIVILKKMRALKTSLAIVTVTQRKIVTP